MAEILITGMEMPKSCLGELDGRNDCPIVGICENFKKSAFNVRVEKSWNQRLEGCPLVEVPPHGRLIDEADLRDRAYKRQIRDRISFHDALVLALMDAPIIIEASKETKAR